MIKVQISLSAPSAENINKLLGALSQGLVKVDLKESPLSRFLKAYPDLNSRDHVLVHVYVISLPETLIRVTRMLNRVPLVISQSFHLYSMTLLELESRLDSYAVETDYASIVQEFNNRLSNI